MPEIPIHFDVNFPQTYCAELVNMPEFRAILFKRVEDEIQTRVSEAEWLATHARLPFVPYFTAYCYMNHSNEQVAGMPVPIAPRVKLLLSVVFLREEVKREPVRLQDPPPAV